MDSELIALKSQLQEKEAQLQTAQAQFEEFKADTIEFEKELEADNQHKEKEIISLTSKLEINTKKLDEYKKESNYLTAALEKEKAKLEQVESEFKALQGRIVFLEQDNATHENEIRNLRFEKEELQTKFEKLEETSIIEMEELCNQFSQKIEALERLRQEMLESQDENAALRKQNEDLLLEKARGSVGDAQQPHQNEQLKQFEELIGHYRTEVEILNKGLEEKSEQIKQYEFQVEYLKEENEGLNEKLRQKELDEIGEDNELEKTKLEIQVLRETLEETDKQIQELNVKLNVSHISLDRSRDYAYDLTLDKPDSSSKDLEILRKTMKEMGAEITSLTEKVKAEKESYTKLQKENEKNIKESKSREKRLTSQKTEINDLKSSLVSERAKNSDLEKRLAKITREMEDKVKKVSRANTLSNVTAKEQPVLKKGIETERRHLRTPDLLKDSSSSPVNGEISRILLTDGDNNDYLAEKVNKMAGDVDVLTNKMAVLQGEKNKLEHEVAQREEIINELMRKFQQNSELMEFVEKLSHENSYLSDKLNRMMGDVETLASKIAIIQTEKAKLEEDAMNREKIIDDLTARYQDNSELLDLVQELEEENSRLKQRMSSMADDVGVLSDKFMELNEYKIQLENDAIRREAAIEELELRYMELEKALQAFRRSSRNGETAPQSSPVPPSHPETGQKEEIEVEANKLPEKTVITSDYQQIRNKNFKNFGAHTLSPNMTNSYSHFDMMDSTTKIEASKNTTSESLQPSLPKITKFLYSKRSRTSLASSIRFDGNQVVMMESSSLKSSRTSTGYTGRAEKSISFNGIARDPKALGLKVFNLKEENILGRSLFFFVYGSKGTDKKTLKQTLVQDVINILKSVSRQNPDKECRLIIRVQDEKLFNKLETSNNYRILDQFTTHQEFVIDDEQNGPLDDMISQLKHFDSQKVGNGGDSSPTRDKPVTKEIFIEFLMQNKEEPNESSSEYHSSTYLTRTKIMIVTTNNIKDNRYLEGVAADDSLIDLILSDKREYNIDRSPSERKSIPNNIEKFFIFTIKPEAETSKGLLNTLALASILDELAKSYKVRPAQTKGKYSTPSPKKTRKGIDTLNNKTTPAKKDKFAHLTILHETPKAKIRELSFDIKAPERISSVSKPDKVAAQESQKLVQQIEDYSKMNPGGRSNMKRLLGALTQMTPTNQSYRTKYESKSSLSMSSIVTPSRNKKGTKAFDFDCPKKEVTMLE